MLRAGGVVLHATEGVWGLAALASDDAAIERLLAIKERERDKGLIVIGADPADFSAELAALPEEAREEVAATWPGAVSWVLPNQRYSGWVTGSHQTVAVRVPGHDQARALCRAAGATLVSTSANRAGEPAPTTEEAARAAMGDRVDFVLPGRTAGRSAPSEVRSWQGEVFRSGTPS